MKWYKISQEIKKHPWEMTRKDYIKSQNSGFISSEAYEKYSTSEGLSFIEYEKYPQLIDTINISNKIVEIKLNTSPNYYIRHDNDGEIVRDKKGLAIYLNEEEMKDKDYSLIDGGVAAFFNRTPIGYASEEWGTSGVWVVKDYQRLGLGTRLLTELHKYNPKLAKKKIGQMTNAGWNMTGSYHKQFVQRAISEGKNIPTEVLKDYPDLIKPINLIEKTIANYDSWYKISARYDEIRKNNYEDEENFNSAQYSSIGQDNENLEGNYCWAWINEKIIAYEGRTHGACFGHSITDKTFKGWYDKEDDIISFVFPRKFNNEPRKSESDIPQIVMRSLLAKFGKTFKIVEF